MSLNLDGVLVGFTDHALARYKQRIGRKMDANEMRVLERAAEIQSIRPKWCKVGPKGENADTVAYLVFKNGCMPLVADPSRLNKFVAVTCIGRRTLPKEDRRMMRDEAREAA